MHVRSLGYRTDLFVSSGSAQTVDRGDYVVVQTPTNPTFYWGNFLLFDKAPKPGDLERWPDLFAREMGARPDVRHVALGWDDPAGTLGDVQPFLDAGFHLYESVVLTSGRVQRPVKFCAEAQVRVLTEDWEWAAAIDNQVACRDEGHDADAWRTFAERKMAHHRTLVAEGRGLWFGAFIDGQLAGDLGLFVFEGIGRFQTVGTHPDFRRRGVCGTLVYHAAAHGLDAMNAERLVMVADAHYHAARIYESVGFVPTERQVGLTLWPS